MKANDALRRARALLGAGGIEEAGIEAEVLLRHLLGMSRAQLYTDGDRELSEEEQRRFRTLVERRRRGEPAAYLTGHREFYGLDLLVDPRVLIPRPESELLVELALRYLRDTGLASSPCLVADIGTGSGALAIALATYLPQALVYATDISPEALDVAAINCRRHGVADRVTLLQGDLLRPLPGLVDVLVANPPYVRQRDMSSLAPEIHDHEPAVALEGGRDGLEVVRRLLPQTPGKLRPGGALFMEVGYDQGAEVRRMAEGLFPGAPVQLERDLSGIERVLTVYTRCAQQPATAGTAEMVGESRSC